MLERTAVRPLLALLLVVLPVSARALERDAALHLSVSAALAGGGYAGAAALGAEGWERALWGAGLSLSAGLAKEAWDATGRGDPSLRDVGWNLAGVAAGLTIALILDGFSSGETGSAALVVF